ncbi:MAG: PilZ domain-containing protein [Mariniblastus sp.]
MTIENSNFNLPEIDSAEPTVVDETFADVDRQERLKRQLEEKQAAASSKEAVDFVFSNADENQRSNVRYQVSLPAVCHPVMASKEIDVTVSLSGVIADISLEGMLIILDTAATPQIGLELIVAVDLPGGGVEFCAGAIVGAKPTSQGFTEISVRFGGYLQGILLHDIIFPILERNQMRFSLPFSDRTLTSLCSLGAATSEVLDKLLVCPRCQAIPTVREGCSLCLSSNVEASKMVHHFACANVDFLENFETPDGMLCQKCRTKNMIVGSDYEYLNGPENCSDCGKSNLEKIQIGHCLSCEYRFPMETAKLLEIVGYRVKRLDILALVDSA